MKAQKIHTLDIENFKRIKVARLTLGDGLIQITGANAQGKSSVLDSIEALFGGKDALPSQPIRHGETTARIVAVLTDAIVTRTFSEKGSRIEVATKEGAVHKAPQSILDKLWHAIGFDPLDFARMAPKEQAALLRKLLGVDTTAIDTERARLYAERTDVNRIVTASKALVGDGPPVVRAPDGGFTLAAEVSIGELVRQQTEAMKVIAANEAVRRKLTERDNAIAAGTRSVSSLKDAMEIAQRRYNESVASLAKVQQDRDAIAAEVEKLVDPDTTAIVAQTETIEKTNADIRATNAAIMKRIAAEDRLLVVQSQSAALTQQIDALDAQKATMLKGITFPVPGLSIDGDTITLNNVPLSQASSAEQLRVGLGVSAELNPTLRAILVRDGSLLDDEGMRIVAEFAAEKDFQILMERVGRASDGIGIVIEDGEVYSAPSQSAVA